MLRIGKDGPRRSPREINSIKLLLNEGFKRYFKAKLSELPGTNASPLITIQVHSKYLHTHTHTQLETKGMSPKTDRER